jgi:hypothetical protein
MGGNALKETQTRRYQKAEFYKLAEELIPMIEKAFGTTTKLTKSYGDKDSFGDMDILILNNSNLPPLRKVIKEYLNPDSDEVHHNGSCWSFAYQGLQVDLILVPEPKWETSLVYFAYNDLGNFIGKIAHQMGLKYGDFGLKYTHYSADDSSKLGEIIVSRDPKKIFEFLGFSWSRYELGFHFLDEIFEYAMSSRYFSTKPFEWDQMNHNARTRDQKRKNYLLFLDYMEKNPKEEYYTPEEDKSKYLEMVDSYFPEAEVLEKVEFYNERYRISQEVTKRFNGHLVMEKYTHLRGKELGDSISAFKNSFEDPEIFTAFILNATDEQIWNKFEEVI